MKMHICDWCGVKLDEKEVKKNLKYISNITQEIQNPDLCLNCSVYASAAIEEIRDKRVKLVGKEDSFIVRSERKILNVLEEVLG